MEPNPNASASVTLSVVVPLFNEEDSVEELITRLRKSCDTLGEPYEIVAINDGSTDKTLSHLLEVSNGVSEVCVLNFARNFGVMSAYRAGLERSKGSAVVVIDGDLQDPPELIGDLFSKWKQGAHVVYGLRRNTHYGLLKKFLCSIYYVTMRRFSDVPIPKDVGTYCLMDRSVVERIKRLQERQFYFAVQRAWVGGIQDSVLYDRDMRRYGRSRVGPRRLLRFARTALISVSNAPLRYVSAFALLMSFTLFCIGFAAVGIRLFLDIAIPGWATYTALLGFIGFVQSFVLAVVAEYIAVIHDEVKGRPLYFVQEEFRGGVPVADQITGNS